MQTEVPTATTAECPPAVSGQRGQAALLVIGLVVFTWAVFWPVRGFEFLDFDDGFYVTLNPYVCSGVSLENVAWAFTTGATGNWHPLTWLSYMLDVQVFGVKPGPMHLTNVCLHTANVLLLFSALHLLTRSLYRSALVAALFAVHPLHVESVAWISERKDVLSTCFGFMALWAYARYAPSRQQRWYWTCLALWVASLMAKQMFVTFPFVLLLLDYWPLARFRTEPGRGAARRLIAEKAPFLAIMVVFCIIAFTVQHRGGAVQSLTRYPLATRVANALTAYVLYLKKTFWPTDLAAFYPHPVGTIPLAWVIAAGGLLATITALAVLCRRRFPFLIIGWLWYLGTLVPVVGLVQIGNQQMADRYTYLPLVGIFMGLSWMAPRGWSSRGLLPKISSAVALGIVVALAVQARHQALTWRNTESLFAHAITVTRPNAFAEATLGGEYRRLGRSAEALRHLERAIAIDPHAKSALNSLGQLMLDGGQPKEALAYYSRALAIDPADPVARHDLVLILFQTGETQAAIEQCEHAIRIDPLNFYAHHDLGNIMLATGNGEESLHQFRAAAAIDPRSALARNSLANALMKLGRTDEAAAVFHQVLRLDPRSAAAWAGLGALEHDRHRFAEALAHFEKAVELDPANAGLRQNLQAELVNVGTELASRNHLEGAIDHLWRAVQIDPRHLDANYRLARALARDRRYEEAAEFFERALELGPNIPEVHFEFAFVLRELGRRDEAARHLQRALVLRPDFPAARSELEGLERDSRRE